MMSIIISTSIRREISEHAETGYPEEVCGVLIGIDNDSGREVAEVRRLDNTEIEDKENSYHIDSLTLGKLEKEADLRGLSLVGFYHSHPDYPAEPSGVDLERAWVYYSYIIQSVENGKPGEMTSWRFSEDNREFSREEVIII